MDKSFDELIGMIKVRHDQLKDSPKILEGFLLHMKSLARYYDEPMDYEELECIYPENLSIAFAVCHPDCASCQFIVEGGTQECQYCGSHMFRLSSAKYTKDSVSVAAESEG